MWKWSVIDWVMAKVSDQTVINKLSNLFHAQLETLKEVGCPQYIVGSLKNKESYVIETAMSSLTVGKIPFIPIVSRFCEYPDDDNTRKIGLENLANMANINAGGVNYDGSSMQESSLIDLWPKGRPYFIPENPYYVIGVSDGADTVKYESAIVARNNISFYGQNAFTLDECINFCIHLKKEEEIKWIISALNSRWKCPYPKYWCTEEEDLPIISNGKIGWWTFCHSYNNIKSTGVSLRAPSCDSRRI